MQMTYEGYLQYATHFFSLVFLSLYFHISYVRETRSKEYTILEIALTFYAILI